VAAPTQQCQELRSLQVLESKSGDLEILVKEGACRLKVAPPALCRRPTEAAPSQLGAGSSHSQRSGLTPPLLGVQARLLRDSPAPAPGKSRVGSPTLARRRPLQGRLLSSLQEPQS
jgi:hypothetical protein